MNRSRMLVLAVFTLALSVGVTLLAYRVLKNRLHGPDDTVQIVVAADKLNLGTRLTAADLRTTAWPKNVPLSGSFQKPEDVIGRGVIINMGANEPVLETKLAPKEGGAGLSSAIPEGMRAVGVKVNDVIGVAGFVVPGSRVDVILSGSTDERMQMDTSKVILENVQVLAAGQNLDQDANGKPQSVQVITLLVTPEDSQRLALASSGDGKIQLALRNPLDLQYANPNAIRRTTLFGGASKDVLPALVQTPADQKGAKQPHKAKKPAVQPVAKVEEPKPAPPPPAPKILNVELIQGDKSKISSFEEKPAKPAESTGDKDKQ